ncbi:MAG: isoleucine--tRNA ligase [Actinobacteria bacterium RBG_16_68_21]|nr:MAG: isoleucine--tRNA ligase [Actinobacteria bacterium RBG_16_68_21]
MTSSKPFTRVSPEVSFPDQEHRILDLWDRVDAFALSVSSRPAESEFTFYDGPPFPTGTPHYGNLLAGVLKDIVPRYWTMRGHRVERRFGWDTHGLPIELEVQAELDLSGPSDIVSFGVERFNEACRERVMENTEAWETITRRIGRWVDFVDDYKTMDLDFMESVWWVFSRLWDQGLVYKAFKVLPYSFGAATPLSNFEVNLGGYRDVEDPSITLRLEVTEGPDPVAPGDVLLVWTTTPWTVPSNLGVQVGEDISYARVTDALRGRPGPYWVAEDRVASLWPDGADISAVVTGATLVGTRYRPVLPYYADLAARGAFVVIVGPNVSTEEGTGLVHTSPAHGEDDFVAFGDAGLAHLLVDPVDEQGRFSEDVPDFAGQNVKEADAGIVRLLEERGALALSERIVHSYPYCWRTFTPIIYKAIPTWFVAVEAIRDRMAELNETIHWVPDHVGTGRFGNWVSQARDWAVSRNRFWGSCIPVWECDAGDHRVCVGGLDDLEARSGVRPTDLHKHVVDAITFPCTECSGTMHRVPEVLDVWFESGAMPYGQSHYPFENKERFERGFPAHYIAEGLDQTRGWFYTLLVHATALFDRAPFRNCVVNGLILAEDGHKMSKSLKNYPDPMSLIDTTGADALRAYLINSPVVRAEPLRFSERGVREVVRTVMLPYWNAYSFFTTYAAADGLRVEDLAAAPAPAARPEIDRWILSVLQSLIGRVNTEMEGYYLYNVIPPLIDFVGDLTNWYIRRSRRRFWTGRGGPAADNGDGIAAFATLYEVLVTFAELMAPVLPFITEAMYQDLVVERRGDGDQGPPSVHLEEYPEADPALIDPDLEAAMGAVREVVALGRSLRVSESIRIRQPLATLTVVSHDAAVRSAVTAHADLIADELNVRAVATSDDEGSLATIGAKPNYRTLGPRFGPGVQAIAAAVAELDGAAVVGLLETGSIEVAGEILTADDVVVTRDPRPGIAVASGDRVSVALDTEITPDLAIEGLARELVKEIQAIRKDTGLAVSDRITVAWSSPSPAIAAAIERHGDWIAAEVLAVEMTETAGGPSPADERAVADEPIRIAISPA